MTQHWLDPEPVVVPRALREAVGGHPLVTETLVRRGFRTVEDAMAFLDPAAYVPAPPEALPGVTATVARLRQAIAQHELICVWGDFDVDGQTATTVLVSMLKDLGADVIHHIPVRATESHGIKVPWLAQELSKGVRVVITCDTGIDAHEAVAYARAEGVDVLITDHHELPEQLPDAFAVVNPHLLPEGHPLGALPGVGVAYKVAQAAYGAAGRVGDADGLLDLVALGIVADVAEQTGDTRYLLQLGLRELRRTRRLGIQELLKSAGVDPANVDEEDIGFAIGPRLNALGRLADANPIVEFLTTEDLTRARIVASELESLNARRRLLCDQVDAAAEARLEREPELLKGSVLVLSDPLWPAGVIGIVANRLVERYQRPVVLLSSPPGEMAHGSARSVEGCHITDAIASQQALLEGFGGHAMAAGVTIDPERIAEFRKGLDRAVSAQLAKRAEVPRLQIHGYLLLDELTLPLVTDLARLAPFGAGNPPLVLATRDLEIVAKRKLGRAGRHLRVTVTDRHENKREVVWWGGDEAALPEGRFDLAFSLRVNTYRGVTSVQLVWQEARAHDEVIATQPVAIPQELVIRDWRGAVDAGIRLAALLEARSTGVVVWAEGRVDEAVPALSRLELMPAETLVIWSSPPGLEPLILALKRVAPREVVLVGQPGGLDEPGTFLTYLAGLAKHALNKKDGWTGVPELAAAMGHREAAVRAGLAWLEAKGMIRVISGGDLALRLAVGGDTDTEMVARSAAELQRVLSETSSYRRFFVHADKDRLLSGLLSQADASSSANSAHRG